MSLTNMKETSITHGLTCQDCMCADYNSLSQPACPQPPAGGVHTVTVSNRHNKESQLTQSLISPTLSSVEYIDILVNFF